MKRKTEKELLSQQMELLAEESKHPDGTGDLARLSDAMCNIYKILEADKDVEEVADDSEPVIQIKSREIGKALRQAMQDSDEGKLPMRRIVSRYCKENHVVVTVKANGKDRAKDLAKEIQLSFHRMRKKLDCDISFEIRY